MDCELCLALTSDSGCHSEQIQAYSPARRVMGTNALKLVVDASPLVVGHMLIVTTHHATRITGENRAHLAASLQWIIDWYTEIFGACTIVCHQSRTGIADSKSGPCIDHAHWHLFPLAGDLLENLIADRIGTLESVTHWSDFLESRYDGEECLFYWDGSDGVAVINPDLPYRQYARSLMGRAIKIGPDLWDWILDSHRTNFEETLLRTRPLNGKRFEL